MEAAGLVRWTGLRRRRAGTRHASHANSVLGSRCIAAPHALTVTGSGCLFLQICKSKL
jgi:hypothetical protein